MNCNCNPTLSYFGLDAHNVQTFFEKLFSLFFLQKIKILDEENDGDPSRTPKREEETSSGNDQLFLSLEQSKYFFLNPSGEQIREITLLAG